MDKYSFKWMYSLIHVENAMQVCLVSDSKISFVLFIILSILFIKLR